MITCSKCSKISQLSECEIIGQAFGGLLVNCTCGSTLSIPDTKLSPRFELLSDLSAGIVGLDSFEQAKMALEFISDGLVEPLDVQFALDLKKRIERLEAKQRKTA